MTRFPEIGSEAFNDCGIGITERVLELSAMGQGIKLDEVDFKRRINNGDIDVKYSDKGFEKPE